MFQFLNPWFANGVPNRTYNRNSCLQHGLAEHLQHRYPTRLSFVHEIAFWSCQIDRPRQDDRAYGKRGSRSYETRSGLGLVPRKRNSLDTKSLTRRGHGVIMTIANKQPALNSWVARVGGVCAPGRALVARGAPILRCVVLKNIQSINTPATGSLRPCLFSDRPFVFCRNCAVEESAWGTRVSGRRKIMEFAL